MALRARHFVVLLLTLSTGCVTVGSPWSFSKSWLQRDKEIRHHERHSDSENVETEAAEKRPPLIASDTESIPGTPAVGLKHDPATRMLIEEELRDATKQERAEWIAFLGTVPTIEVAELLKERRMAMRRETEQLAILPGDRTAESDEKPEIIPTAHSISPGANLGGPSDAESMATAEGVESIPASDMAGVSQGMDVSPAATAGHPNGPLWQKKFRSLADPNRLWAHPGNEAGITEHSTGVKPERIPFGLPQVRSNRGENVHEEALVVAASVPSPTQSSSIESRITPGSALWEDEIAKLISLLEAEVSSGSGSDLNASRQDTRKQVALRMLYLIANDPQKALQVIPGLPSEEQEFWTALFLGLSEYLEEADANDPAERATQIIAQLRTAAYHLQQSANLRLRNLAFCQQINGFGNYETFPEDQFTPGQTVLIYAEIRNFKSAPTQAGQFLTRIRSTIEIYAVSNGQQLVDRSTFDPTEDYSRTLRTDYYHSYRLDLPANLVRGPHLVKLILQDELTGKQTTESINFTVK